MGVDIAEVGRIRAAIERHGETFLRRVYTADEREYCEQFRNKYERYAGRFAAKEAAMKALGTGKADGLVGRSCAVICGRVGSEADRTLDYAYGSAGAGAGDFRELRVRS